MNQLTEIALKWLALGIAPIPCYYRSKRSRVMWEKYQTVLPSADQVKAWFASQYNNLAIVTGWSNLVVIDFDSFDGYELWLDWHVNNTPPTEQPIFDNTLRVITSRGVHIYIRCDETINTSHVSGVVDIKATGYVVTYPSIHPSGRHYKSNELDVARVKTLEGVVPSEWLQHNTGQGNWQAPATLSGDPLDRIDQSSVSLVQTLRNRFRIQDFITGAKQTHDGWLVARCPFHEDKEPSFWIDTKRQICGCHVGCTPKPLDVINLFGKLHGFDNSNAIRALAERI